MIAYISGEQARGIVLKAGVYHGYALDNDVVLPLTKQAEASFFTLSDDIEKVDCETVEQLKLLTESAWKKDRTLRLTLMAIDPTHELETRIEAALCVDDFLSDEECAYYLASIL